MAATADHPRGEASWNEAGSAFAEQLLEAYQATREERSRLHLAAHDADYSRAAEALELIEVPMDEVVGIANTPRQRLSEALAGEFIDRLSRSPLARQHVLLAWLRGDAHCAQVALLLERADHLRLMLLCDLLERRGLSEKKSA